MAQHTIKVPDLGEGVAEVELVAWRVQVGDRVAEDQPLADVMTDKATVEVPSPVTGRVLRLGGEVGQLLAVGAELIRIEVGDATAHSETSADQSPAGELAASVASVPPASAPPRATGSTQPPAPRKPIASPAVRARAWELGIDLNDVPASAMAGRIVHADLDAFAARGAVRRTPQAPSARTAAAPEATHSIKIVGLRRRIAQRMQDSKRRIPHFAYVEEVDVTELEALRAQLNAKWGAQRGHLTLLPFLIRATAQAVREFAQVNSHFDDAAGVLTRFDAVHVGIATQTDAGLMVPVLRDARSRDLWGTAAEVTRLAGAARNGKAVRDELSGSTITLTSLGRLGGVMSTPVINPPEVAIVGVNAIVSRPVIRDGAVVARQMMNLSSSFDHRVVDGAVGAGFVQSLRRQLENPALLFVESG